MRVEAADQAEPGQTGDSVDDFANDLDRESVEPAAPESRALVVIDAAAAAAQTAPVYREAAFLAHLIATKEQAPQTRERRRAEPGEAISAYRAAMAMV
jgi:hypothetical protein